jgi:hypothetical protein
MQVQIKEIEQEKVFKPVMVALNFENKADFDMFFHMVSYNESIPELVAKGSPKDYNHCQKLLTAIHKSMREYLD